MLPSSGYNPSVGRFFPHSGAREPSEQQRRRLTSATANRRERGRVREREGGDMEGSEQPETTLQQHLPANTTSPWTFTGEAHRHMEQLVPTNNHLAYYNITERHN